MNDPEEVDAMAEQGLFKESDQKRTTRISEDTPLLSAINDLLIELRIANRLAAQSKKPIEMPPETSMPLVREAQSRAKKTDYEDLKAFFSS